MMFDLPLDRPDLYLVLCLKVVSVSCVIFSAEFLYLHREFRDGGLFSWRVRRERAFFKRNAFCLPAADRILSYPAILFLIAIYGFLGLCNVFIFSTPDFLGVSCLLISAIGFLVRIRGNTGLSGSDQYVRVVLAAGGIALLSGSYYCIVAALVFIAGQLTIHYMGGGWMRIQHAAWRDGTYLTRVFGLHTYGRGMAHAIAVRFPEMARYASMSVLLFEVAFVLFYFLPPPTLYFVLAYIALFHVLVALVMGLNNFLWSFVGSFPAFIWVALKIQSLIYA